MTQGAKVVCLGDSLTAGHIAGMGWPRYAPFTDVLGEQLPQVRFINAGMDGDLTTGMLSRLEHHVLVHQPQLCVLLGGANDLGWGRSPSAIADVLAAIADRVTGAGVDLLLCAIPPIMGYPEGTSLRHDLNGQIRELARDRGMGYADLFAPLALEDGSLDPRRSSDGLHLNESGYRILGETLAPLLEQRLAPSTGS